MELLPKQMIVKIWGMHRQATKIFYVCNAYFDWRTRKPWHVLLYQNSLKKIDSTYMKLSLYTFSLMSIK